MHVIGGEAIQTRHTILAITMEKKGKRKKNDIRGTIYKLDLIIFFSA